MKLLITIILTITALLITMSVLYAQPPGLPAIPPQAPIDGGLGLLAAAGGVYALKKLRDKNKGKEHDEN